MSKYILKIICILLLVGSLTLLLLPSWTVEGEDISAAEYVLHPGDYKDLTKEFRDITDSRKLTTRNALPIFVLLVASAGCAVLSLVSIKKDAPVICTPLTGALGVYVYATNILLKAGKLALCGTILSAVMLLVGAGVLVYFRMNRTDE